MHRVLDSRINNDQTLRTVYNSYTYTLFASVNLSKYFRTLVSGDDELFHQLQYINAVQNAFVNMANSHGVEPPLSTGRPQERFQATQATEASLCCRRGSWVDKE